MVNKLSSAGIGSIKLRFYLAQLSWNLRKKLSPAGISSEKLSSKDMSLIQFFSAKLKILHVPNSCLLFFDKDKLLILAVYCYLYMVHPYQLSPDWRFERSWRQSFFGWAGLVEFSWGSLVLWVGLGFVSLVWSVWWVALGVLWVLLGQLDGLHWVRWVGWVELD